MAVKDELVEQYFRLCTRVPMSEVEEILAGHPKEAKMRLAREIVTLYHGAPAAQKAESGFMKPDEAPTISVSRGAKLRDIAGEIGVSMSELRRLVEAGAIEVVGGEKVSTIDAELDASTLKVGKHRFIKIVVK